jgi:nitric oxide reductase large subunit
MESTDNPCVQDRTTELLIVVLLMVSIAAWAATGWMTVPRYRLGLWAFWLYNLGLALWVLMNVLPMGIPPLEVVDERGYADALSLDFYRT